MHEAEPLLYWRVRRNGVWKFERAKYVALAHDDYTKYYIIEPPKVVNESE